MNVWIIEILKGEKTIWANLWIFSQLPILIFYIYLFLILKTSNIGKNTKFPKSHLTHLLIKMSYSYSIFNFENCSSLFQILIIYALN